MNSFNQIARPIMRKLLLLSSLFILSLIPSVLNSIHFVSYINQFINRKVMFLFCNAILLFIVRDSGLLLPPSVTNLCDDELIVIKRSKARSQNNGVEVKETSITVIPDKLVSEQSITRNAIMAEKLAEPLELVVVEEVTEELEIVSDAVKLQNPNPNCIHNVNRIESIADDLEVDEFNRRCEEFIEKTKRARLMEIGRRIEIK